VEGMWHDSSSGGFISWHLIQRSGLTQREFCRQEHLPVSTFYYWKKKFGNDTKRKPELVKIEATNIPSAKSFFVLDFPGGVKLTIPLHYHSDHLKRLIFDLREVL
jgi:hypothetical protein